MTMISKQIGMIMSLMACTCLPLMAQEVKGKVVDEAKQPVEAATVIMQTPDSTFIDAIITDSLGCFVFKEEPTCYRLIFQHLLFKTFEKENCGPDAGIITLKGQDYALNEVVVTGERPLVKADKGTLVYDAQVLSERTTASNAYESLLRLPGVMELNDELSLTGTKDMNILINGKPSSMNQDQLITLLKSTPVSQVKKIEVMYNAPAKYRIRGAAINIVLDNGKSTDPFWKGEVSGNYQQLVHANGDGNINLSYTGKKLSADINYAAGYRHKDSGMENDSHHTLHDKVYSIQQVNETEAKHWRHNVRFGLDYQLSEGNSLHTAYTGSFQAKGNTTTRSKGNYSDSESFRTSQEQMHNVNLDYTAAFGLNVGLDYTHFNSPSTQDFTNYLNARKQHFLVDERQTIDRWNVYAGQNHDLPQGWGLNYGINFTFAREKSGQLYQLDAGTDLPVTNTDTHMREETYNFYVGTEKSFNNQLSMSLSLAGEYYRLMDYQQWAVYPTFQLSYQPSSEHIFQLGFSSDKAYPNYWELQDITSYINGYMKLKGNPYLRPSTDYTASLTYIFKGKYIANVYYSHVKDFFSQLPYQSPDELALVYQSINLDYEQNAGLSLIIPFSVGTWWTAQCMFDGSYNQDVCDKYYNISLNRNNWRGIVQMNNTFRLSSRPSLQLEYNLLYVSPTLQGIYDVSSVWKMDLGLKWTFANDKAELKIQGNDLFNTCVPDGKIDYKGQKLNMNMQNINRNLSITFTYRFNGYKEKKHKEVDRSRFGY